MKRVIAEDGTRTHELTKTENGAVRKAILVVEEVAFFHRGTFDGDALGVLADSLALLYVGEPLVAESPPDAKAE